MLIFSCPPPLVPQDYCTNFEEVYICRLFRTVTEGGEWNKCDPQPCPLQVNVPMADTVPTASVQVHVCWRVEAGQRRWLWQQHHGWRQPAVLRAPEAPVPHVVSHAASVLECRDRAQ